MYQVIKEYIQSQNKDYISKCINIKDHNMFILSDRRHIYTINLGSGEKISIKRVSNKLSYTGNTTKPKWLKLLKQKDEQIKLKRKQQSWY